MKYTVEKLEKNEVKVNFKLTAEEWRNAVLEGYNKTKHKYSFPGFRKGKVPRNVLENAYGHGLFYDDAINACFPKYFGDVLNKEKDIQPVDRPTIEIQDLSEKGAEFTAVVIVKPEVTLGAITDISYKKPSFDVSEDDVDAEIKKAQEKLMRVVDVTDRAVKNGDLTTIDYMGIVDGTMFEGGTAQKQPLEIGSNSFIPGFEKQVIGMKIGDEKDVNVTFPKKYHAENLAGKEAVFKVKLHEIKEKQYPALDDEFAKDVSEFETLANYKADVKKKLEEAKKKNAETESENDLVARIVDKAKVEIPQVMIDSEIQHMIENLSYRFSSQGLKFEDYLKYTGTSLEALKQSYLEPATAQAKTQLVIDKIIKTNNFEADKEAVDAKVKEYAEQAKKKVKEFKDSLSEDQMYYVKNEVVMDKLFNFLKENNKATATKTLLEEKTAKEEKKKEAEKAEKSAPKAKAEKEEKAE